MAEEGGDEHLTDGEDPKAEPLVTTDEEEAEEGRVDQEIIPVDEEQSETQLAQLVESVESGEVQIDNEAVDENVGGDKRNSNDSSSGDGEREEEAIIEDDDDYDYEEEGGEDGPLQIDDAVGEVEFIKPPKKDIDQWDLDDYIEDEELAELGRNESKMSIHVSQIKVTDVEEALEIANQIMQVLEDDVNLYLQTTGIVLEEWKKPEEEEESLPREKISGSSMSISSDISDVLPGEPSTLFMQYEKGHAAHRDISIPHIAGEGVDEICEVTLHRSRKYHGKGPPQKASISAQTKEMTFLPDSKAQFIFMEMYPKPDDWAPAPLPSRMPSMQIAIEAAEQEDPNVDRTRKGPQIINFSNRKKLLQPLKDDYYKDETFWTGSRFRGQYKNRQFFKGQYDHPTGVKYQSEWKDGHFHTSKHLGAMMYPRGDVFEGEWNKGRYMSGEITFGDGLKYTAGHWSYCEVPDRRLRVERYYGMKPAGNTIYNDQYPAPKLPPGCYDVGDGIYDPKKGEVRGYDGFFIRHVNATEDDWIKRNCRKALSPGEEYIPSFNVDRIPGSYMEQLQRFSITKRNYH